MKHSSKKQKLFKLFSNELFQVIMGIIFVTTFIYLIGSFVELSFNPKDWAKEARIICSILCCLFSLMIFLTPFSE